MFVLNFRIMLRNLISVFIICISFSVLTSCKSDDSGESVNDPKAENRLGLGNSAEDILSDDIYSSLTVELVYSNGYRPSDVALNEFKSFITSLVNKPAGITFVENQIEAPTGSPFTIQDIRDIEDEHRTIYTEGTDIALYVFFSNGNDSGDTSNSFTLGTAYQNTSIVVYQKTLQELTINDPISVLQNLEASTLNHEMGHILGLVNILEDDIHPENHEDEDHNKHCVVEDCLMYFEASTTRMVEFVRQRRAIPTLDPLCIADLEAKGALTN